MRLLPLTVVNWMSIAIIAFFCWERFHWSWSKRQSTLIHIQEMNGRESCQPNLLYHFFLCNCTRIATQNNHQNRMSDLQNQSIVIFVKWHFISKPKCFPKLNGKHWDIRKVVRTIRYNPVNPDWYLDFCKKNEIEDKSCV